MARSLFALGIAVLALAQVPSGSAATTQLFPGVTYETGVQFTPHGPVALHIVRGPRPVGLHRLRPVLSNETVVGRETVSSMQRRLAPQGTFVGVNADFYASKKGGPSGIFLRDGVLVSTPSANRSSAGIGVDGTLDVRKIRLFGTWRGLGQRRPLTFNEPPGANGISLFTSDWGAVTPRIQGASSVVLSPFPSATPNVDLFSTVTSTSQSPSVRLSSGSAVLVARGTAAEKLSAEAPVGTLLTFRLILQPDWTSVPDAVGGGPVLVRDGAPVFRANEGFTTQQLAPRHPRSAVGQLADGRILLVAVDGRQTGYSVGMTTFELAQAMARLGAVRAMALDGGGSTTLAFDGTVLNKPSDGQERPVPTALMLAYYGVFASPPAEPVVSPNGDGVADQQELEYKLARSSTATATLTAPDGTIAFQETATREPGVYEVPFPPAPIVPPETVPPAQPVEPEPPAEGRWTLTVKATDDEGQASTSVRRFWVNSTLGFLKVQPATLFVPRTGRVATIAWTQARPGQVTVVIETPSGVPVRTIVKRRFEVGAATTSWDGRLRNGEPAFGGVYRVRVVARNEVGTVSLDRPLRIRRVASSGS